MDAVHHSPDRSWWWDGAVWRRAYSADGRRWFNGRRWIRVAPHWRRWSNPVGLASLVAGIFGAVVDGLAAMGDPGEGHPKQLPAWWGSVEIFAVALVAVGLALLAAAPVYQRLCRNRER